MHGLERRGRWRGVLGEIVDDGSKTSARWTTIALCREMNMDYGSGLKAELHLAAYKHLD